MTHPVRIPLFAITLAAAVGAAALWLHDPAPGRAAAMRAALDCPPGYTPADPVVIARERNPHLGDAAAAELRAAYGEQACVYQRLPEAFTEAGQLGQEKAIANAAPHGVIPDGAHRRAVEQKAAMATLKAEVRNALGAWLPYGVGPQVQDAAYLDGSRDGIPETMGRVDDFSYDEVNQRLFVAVGTGGIWMSEAVAGDVGTLGDFWVPISDNLPTTITSAVRWTTARGGRLVVLTGEHVQGGNTYVGLGAYWSDDLGASWNHAAGIPDGAGASTVEVDLSNPEIIYAATHRGLFRSTDAGESFVNVGLPVSEDCAGVFETTGPCQLANVVSDVVIRQPGGLDVTGLSPTVCALEGCMVLAAVGYRSGNAPYADGVPQSPGNGLYRSLTGEPGTFEKIAPLSGAINEIDLDPTGFPSQARVGRVELGVANGPQQDHNIVYAIVQDAVLMNGGFPVLDQPTDLGAPAKPIDCQEVGGPGSLERLVCSLAPGDISPTVINGVYVSRDFGGSWIRLADDVELTYNLTTNSVLAPVIPLGIGPGVQAWYDLWIQPDPYTSLGVPGVGFAPVRVLFGMEEIWKNRVNAPVLGLEQTNNDFKVIGQYFSGETCAFLIGNIGPPTTVCPFRDGSVQTGTTTHPDQHDAIFIADAQRGGVWVFVGHDGGVHKQYSADPYTDDFDNTKWGNGANHGFYTLMNYGIDVAKDGTVWYGLQDNSSGKIEPATRRQLRTYVGDGMWTWVDPDHSRIAYVSTPGLSINRTTDGGITHELIAPDGDFPDETVGVAHFLSPYMMDPRSADHLVAAGTRVAELSLASQAENWATVYDLGTNPETGDLYQARSLSLDVEGKAIYVGACGPCYVVPGSATFSRKLATNIGGARAPRTGTADGWHDASAAGLPNRYIQAIEIDPENVSTVYVGLAGYSTARWHSPGTYLDENPAIGSGNIFVSFDAGETFSNISGNLPDTPVTAILKRGGQLIVGTDLGAFISADLNGTTWAPLGDLPNVPINQLVLQPDNTRALFAGTFGRGVQVYYFSDEVPDPRSGQRKPSRAASPAPAVGDSAVSLPGPRGGAPGWWLMMLAAAALGRRYR